MARSIRVEDVMAAEAVHILLLLVITSGAAFLAGRQLVRWGQRGCTICPAGVRDKRGSRRRSRHANGGELPDEEVGLAAGQAQLPLEDRVCALEAALQSMRVEQEQARSYLVEQLEAERSQRFKLSESLSKLLEETCAAVQHELAVEQRKRQEVVSELQASISMLRRSR
ncbi:hypothetical protein AB1Y20_003093 [Prymnesium parvum]|uniref:Uncharacterized protein n=1 Tax=Prymnesium parvum TaxID=97485 RepID=A0AB34JDN9_PRYPA